MAASFRHEKDALWLLEYLSRMGRFLQAPVPTLDSPLLDTTTRKNPGKTKT